MRSHRHLAPFDPTAQADYRFVHFDGDVQAQPFAIAAERRAAATT
jgi:hypothetical protein